MKMNFFQKHTSLITSFNSIDAKMFQLLNFVAQLKVSIVSYHEAAKPLLLMTQMPTI